jgi:hypothetical protein
MAETGPIETADQFKPTPPGQQERWTVEIAAARENLKDWHPQGDEAVKRYLGEHRPKGKSGLNLFHADVNTMRSMLYGKIPTVDVTRRFNDPDDDIGRVAAEMEERLLNTDIDRDDDGFKAALRYALEDWTLPGLGVARVRYEVEWETQPETPAITGSCDCMKMNGVEPLAGSPPVLHSSPLPGCPTCQGSGEKELAPAVPEQEVKADEDVETDYVYWRKFLWSPCRSWNFCRWVAFGTDMTRDELVERFGEEVAKTVQVKKAEKKDGEDLPLAVKESWSKAEVWEVWDKDTRTVYWFSEGAPQILDSKEDPLGLTEFFPCPRPLFSNETTSKLVPKPDHEIAKVQYDEIEEMDLRLAALIKMARVRGAYDKSRAPELGRILDAGEGDMIGVERWVDLAEKGGLKSALEFIPLEAIVKAIEVLTVKRQEAIALVRQVTGMSDIMRGQAAGRATATEQSIKAQFASTRIQTAQDELARFASDLQALRAEIIAKHFDPQTIRQRSNIDRTQDAGRAEEAIALLKDKFAEYRVMVRPESLAMQDMATLRQERAEALTALGSHFQAMMPLVQLGAGVPGGLQAVLAFVIRTGQWMVAGLRGASEVEAAFDTFADAAQKIASQPPPPPQPDPKMETEKVKAGAAQFQAQADMAQTQMDMEASQVEHSQRMREMAMKGAQQRMAVQGMAPAPMAQPGSTGGM